MPHPKKSKQSQNTVLHRKSQIAKQRSKNRKLDNKTSANPAEGRAQSSSLTAEDDVTAVILAAGRGTRMKSEIPKVLHRILGRPLIEWVIEAAREAGIRRVVVVLPKDISGFEDFIQKWRALMPEFVVTSQLEARGTGDAVAAALTGFRGLRMPPYAKGVCLSNNPLNVKPQSRMCILAADVPGIQGKTLRYVISESQRADLAVVAMEPDQPFGYGRLICKSAQKTSASKNTARLIQKIVEEKDASPREKSIGVCNSGIIVGNIHYVSELLSGLTNDNAQKEYYLTDICQEAWRRKNPALAIGGTRENGDGYRLFKEFLGVNDRAQLSDMEHDLLDRKRRHHMKNGVTFTAAESIYLDASVEFGRDIQIGPQAIILGTSNIGDGTIIGPRCVVDHATLGKNVRLGMGVVIKDQTVPDGAVL